MESTAEKNAELEQKFRHFIESADREKGMVMMAAVSHAAGDKCDAIVNVSRRIPIVDEAVKMLALLMYAALNGFDKEDREPALSEAADMVHEILRMNLDAGAAPVNSDDFMPDADPAVPMQ